MNIIECTLGTDQSGSKNERVEVQREAGTERGSFLLTLAYPDPGRICWIIHGNQLTFYSPMRR